MESFYQSTMVCWVQLARLQGKKVYLPSGKALYLDYIGNACLEGWGLDYMNLYVRYFLLIKSVVSCFSSHNSIAFSVHGTGQESLRGWKFCWRCTFNQEDTSWAYNWWEYRIYFHTSCWHKNMKIHRAYKVISLYFCMCSPSSHPPRYRPAERLDFLYR